jgi:RNA polymerase sigma-70 factor (ECF subfamily)
VVRNALWNSLNKNRRFLEKEVLLADFPETPWSAPEDLEMDENLQAALDALPPENRQAVEMLKLKEISVEKASQQLGISKVAFKVRAHRGYVQLRKILSKGKTSE